MPDVFFRETAKGKHIPRAILTDLKPDTLDTIKAGKMGHLFMPSNYIKGKSGGSNNWALGHYIDGAMLV